MIIVLKQEAKNEIHPIVYAGPDHLFLWAPKNAGAACGTSVREYLIPLRDHRFYSERHLQWR